jgi:hypothetical protein
MNQSRPRQLPAPAKTAATPGKKTIPKQRLLEMLAKRAAERSCIESLSEG